MSKTGKKYFNLLSCRHCGNISKMEILGTVEKKFEEYDPDYGPLYYGGTYWNVLECPACEKDNVVRYDWHDSMESDDEVKYEFLYPQNPTYPLGLTDEILKAYLAAEKVKVIDVNAYAILVRRLLELVCLDREAKGKTLALMLEDLSNKGEIPEKLVKVAKGLKDFGNVGAHAGSGKLSKQEIPIVTALCKAILEYVYSAPHLAELAEIKLSKIRKRK